MFLRHLVRSHKGYWSMYFPPSCERQRERAILKMLFFRSDCSICWTMQTNPSDPNSVASCSSGFTWDLRGHLVIVTLFEGSLHFPLSSAQAVGHPNNFKSQLHSLSGMGHLRLGGAEGGRCVVYSHVKGDIWGQLFLAVSPPQSLCTASLVGWVRSWNTPWLCALQEWKRPCVTNVVLSTHPKHSPVQATVEKINPLPPQTGTLGFFLPQKIPSRGTLV